MLLWWHFWVLLPGERVLLQRRLPVEPVRTFVWWGSRLKHLNLRGVFGHVHCLRSFGSLVLSGVFERGDV